MCEQRQIVGFLTTKDLDVRRFIRNKRRLIDLLNEQAQSVIDRAVTRGLNPNAPMKQANVNLRGDFPEHWELRRLKALAQIRYGLGQPPRELKRGLPLIRATNVDHGRIVEKDLVFVDPAAVPLTRRAFLDEGEIVVVRSGAYTADSAIIPKAFAGAVAGYDMVVTVRKALPEFIALCLLSSYVRVDQLVLASSRAAQPHLNAEELGTSLILVPPMDQQQAIVESVHRDLGVIEAAIARVQREIELIREYRARFIADVVTGKLDVRHLTVTSDAPFPDLGSMFDVEESPEELPSTEQIEAAVEVAIGDE